MKRYVLKYWNGVANHAVDIEADSYDEAVAIYAGRLPPGYVWHVEPA